MHVDRLVALLAFVPISLTSPLKPLEHVVHEKRDVSTDWIKHSRVPSGNTLPVRIALAQQNLHKGHEYLMEISDPTSSRYGKHWMSSEVIEAFSPSEATLNATTEWLVDAGITTDRLRSEKNLGFLAFDATVEELEVLLRTEYYIHEHTSHEHKGVACDQYHVPVHLKEHIDFITPGIGLSIPPEQTHASNRHQKRADGCPLSPSIENTTLEDCWHAARPECVNALYNIPKDTREHPENRFGIFTAFGSYIQTDMDLFFSSVATQVPVGTAPRKNLINGAQIQTNYTALNVEPNLDFQIAWPLVFPQNLTLFNSAPTEAQLALDGGVSSANTSLLLSHAVNNMLTSIDGSYCRNSTDRPCGTFQAPKVLSISYTCNETAIPKAAAMRMCNEFLKLGLQGTTVLVCAGGDAGVAARGNACINQTVFNPSCLASCPWVTSVGATQLQPNQSVYGRNESAAFQPRFNFSSSGGFSNYHPSPHYQQDAVARYLYHHHPPFPSYVYNGSSSSIGSDGGRFSRNGRGFPDVSALGTNFITVNNGCLNADGGGTSAATPIFAAVIWKINAERLSAGKSTLGFVNPALYANPQVLNDVTSGNNPGCGTNGFAAGVGWDPVTGLGTPNYPRMRELFMNLP